MNPVDNLIGAKIEWIAYSDLAVEKRNSVVLNTLSLGLEDGTTLIVTPRYGFTFEVERSSRPRRLQLNKGE